MVVVFLLGGSSGGGEGVANHGEVRCRNDDGIQEK